MSARAYHERDAAVKEVIVTLRRRDLPKYEFERRHLGSRLAPTIDILRNAWGFQIDGDGSKENPYRLRNRTMGPTRVRVTPGLKSAYYDSDHWKETRELRLCRDNYCCIQCNNPDDLQVHHLRYRLFEEQLDELQTLCRFHHEMVHENSRLSFPSGMAIDKARMLGAGVDIPEWLWPNFMEAQTTLPF